MAKKTTKFDRGVKLKKEDLTTNPLLEQGELATDSTDDKLKYRKAASTDEVILKEEAQDLENKTIDATAATGNNTITMDADDVSYDNSTSGLAATEVKSAIDELKAGLEGQNEASEISFDDTNPNVTGTNVQDAIDDVADSAASVGTGLSDHLADAIDAHDASAISNVPSGNLAATDVQGALDELQSDIDTRVVDGGTFTAGSVVDPTRLDVKKDTEANLIIYAATASDGQLCFATDTQKMYQVISSELAPIGGGGATSFEIEQTAHGFAVGEGIYHDGADWVKGLADDADTLAYFTIVQVIDANTFIAADFGRIEVPAHGYNVGGFYFLSNTVAGQATDTEPSQGFSNPLFYVEDANTLQVKVYRPNNLGDSITLDSLADVSAASPLDSQVLAWDNGNQRWEAKDAVSAAADVTYDNATSGLSATDAQAAIDEVEARVDTAEANIISNDSDIATNAADIATTDAKLTNSVKGDILTHNSSANVSLPVGLDGQFIVADSDEASGLKYTSSLQGKLNPITDWQSYTPVLTGFGTTTLESFSYRRVGDTLEIKGFFAAGTPTATTAKVALPDGLIYDISKHDSSAASGNENVGYWTRTGTDINHGGMVLANTVSTNTLEFTSPKVFSSTSAASLDSETGNNVLGASEGMSLLARIPIQGWTSGLDAAVQDIQLTAETANELSAIIDATSGTPVLVSSNYDWIDSITDVGTGNYRINYKAGLFTQEASVAVSQLISGHTQVYLSDATGFDLITRNTGTTPQDTISRVVVSKQGVDVNKSQVIAGTFENINSTDLVMVSGDGNGGETLTANVTPVTFTESDDPSNAWDGTTFTAPKDGRYFFKGAMNFTTSNNRNFYFYADRNVGSYSRDKFLSPMVNATNSVFGINGVIDLLAGDKVQIRETSNGGTLSDANDNLHYIKITQSADYEAIVKNLNDNNNFVSQTKYLSANTSSTGVLPDLTFNNLEIGKKYNIILNHAVVWNSTATALSSIVFEQGDGTDVTESVIGGQHNSGNQNVMIGINYNFTATQTSVQFNLNNSTGTSLLGNGTARRTYATLTELPDSQIINSNKFD